MRHLLRAALIAGTMLAPVAAGAQSGLDGRVDKLEREMKAVQRTVFPGGAGKTLQPDITPPEVTTTAPGVPATSALADLEARVAAVERQQMTLTGQIEQNQFKLRQLEEQFTAYKAATDSKLASGAPTIAAEPVDTATNRPTPGPSPKPATGATRPTTGTTTPPATAKPDPGRADRAAAIERPSTGDAPEDSYLYGYRLWEAKLYPEAEAALKDTVAKYPKHRRASYAQNLLGRAYLDEGRPSLASMAFYDSFKKWPDGERAPDSLYFLGQSLMKLGKPAEACTVYGELNASYGSKIGPDLKAKVEKGRVDAKCK